MHVYKTQVVLRYDNAELARVELCPGEYVIGRSPEVAIYADTPLLSRRHAQLTIAEDQVLLEDLGSSNGTFVGEERISDSTRLTPGKYLQLGDVELCIESPRGSAADPGGVPQVVLDGHAYAIGEQIAQGGMGAILAARQTALERPVAMKVILDDAHPDAVRRFVEEAKVTGQLTHPNIVPIHELGINERGQVFYTMKMVRGITLQKVINLLAEGVEATRKKYPLPALLTIFQKACDAVAFAHAHGVIHRDLKPENIMLGDYGEVLVMDWGLAKRMGSGGSIIAANATGAAGFDPDALAASGSTLAGTIMGTPAYMAPEQARGEVETLDARSDIYSLGAILFELLHLRPTVTGRTAMEIVHKVERNEVAAPEAGRVPDSLAAVVRKAMAPQQAARYASVEDLQRDLTAYQNGFATSAEHAGAWKQLMLLVKRNKAASIGLAAVLLVGGIFGTKALIEGQRAEREAIRANKALADLKKSAPALLQLAESEAGFQRFDSALEKLESALVLDPALPRAYWQRAWLLLAQNKWKEAVDAMHRAKEMDPANTDNAAILPAIERLASLGAAGRESSADGAAVMNHLRQAGATGVATALSGILKMGGKDRIAIVRQRVSEWLGPEATKTVTFKGGSSIYVNLSKAPINTIEPLRGLPIDTLNLSDTKVTNLDPLRGMPLTGLSLYGVPIESLEPLAGLPLQSLHIRNAPIGDLGPLRGMPLINLSLAETQVTSLEPVRGMKLMRLDLDGSKVRDLSPLAGMPLDTLNLQRNPVTDLTPLRGMPLQGLDLRSIPAVDLSPLQKLPLQSLDIFGISPKADISFLLDIPSLSRLRLCVGQAGFEKLRAHPGLKEIDLQMRGKQGPPDYRPASVVWAAYDAQKSAVPAK